MNNIRYIQEYSKVISNKLISENLWETILESPKIAQIAKPGQFINILPKKKWNHVMRRPMSIGGTNKDNIKILFKIIGPGTNLMAQWKEGDKIDIIGPLGNKWGNSKNRLPILISGGVGVVPLLFLREYFQSQNIEHIFIMGARTKYEHFMDHNPDLGVWLSTDDGSYGIKGDVLKVIHEIADKQNINNFKIFACGPSQMLESIRNYSNNNNIECELALECVMACGIGICQGCAVEMSHKKYKNKSYRNQIKLVCIDGPIFKGEELKSCLE